MKPICFKRHRFHPDIIRQAVWLYFRFTTSLRDVEEMETVILHEQEYLREHGQDAPPGAGGRP